MRRIRDSIFPSGGNIGAAPFGVSDQLVGDQHKRVFAGLAHISDRLIMRQIEFVPSDSEALQRSQEEFRRKEEIRSYLLEKLRHRIC